MPQEPIRVEVPDLGVIEFPAGTAEADMKKAIDAQIAQSHVAQKQPVPHPVVQRMLEWLPAAGGMIGGALGGTTGAAALGIGALPGAVGGAMAGGAAGRVLENLGNAAVGNPAPPSIAESLGSIGRAGLTQGATEVAGAGLAAGAKALAPVLMQSAVKPGIKATARAIAKGVAAEDLPVIKTLLNEGVNVSPGGIAKLNRIINASNEEVADAVKNAGGYVYPELVAARTEPLAAKAAIQVNPAADVAAIKGSAKQFLASRGPMLPAKPLTVAEAQAMKEGTYKSLGEKAYGELKTPAIEAQKALARGLKEDIETEALKSGVDVAQINAREGAAIKAKEAIARRIAVAGNRDPVALAWLAHNPVAGLLFIMERSPAIKSMLARGLYQSASRASKVPENVLRLLVTSVATSEDDQ